MNNDLKILIMLVGAFILTGYFSYVSAGLTNEEFGGKIVEAKAIEIDVLEKAGFVCAVPGKTILITPVGAYPANYLVPPTTISKTKAGTKKGQIIKGFYSPTKTPIICTNSESGVTKTVNLNPITMFGTSIK